MKDSWKTDPDHPPRFVRTAIRRGLKLADLIRVETANDKSWITITFKKAKVKR